LESLHDVLLEVQMVGINSAKWCALYLADIVQVSWNPLFTYFFAYLSFRVLWLLRQALYQLSHSARWIHYLQ
jgi:hypothetical protein